MRRKFWLTFLIIGASVVLLVGGVLLLPKATNTSDPPAMPSPLAPVFFPSALAADMNSARAQAEILAEEWSGDAQLLDVSASWRGANGETLLQGPRSWNLLFYSAARAALLYVTADSWNAQQVRETTARQSIVPLDMAVVEIDAGEAAMLFLAAEGQSFLQAHSDATVHLFLSARENQNPLWSIIALAPGGEPVGLSIDAVTGSTMPVTTGGEP